MISVSERASPLEAEGSVWLSDEERAGQRLALTYVGEPPPALRPPEHRGASAAV